MSALYVKSAILALSGAIVSKTVDNTTALFTSTKSQTLFHLKQVAVTLNDLDRP